MNGWKSRMSICSNNLVSVHKCTLLGVLLYIMSPPAGADIVINRPVPEKIQDSPLFQSKSWLPPPPKVEKKPPPPVVAYTPPPPPPTAPPLPFGFIGRMFDGQQMILFLNKNNQQYAVKVKDVIDNTYRIEQINANDAVLTYLPLNMQQTLAFNSIAIGSAAWRDIATTTAR